MRITRILLAMSSALMLGSCGHSVEKDNKATIPQVSLNNDLPDALKVQFDALTDAYFALKDALVAGDAEQARTEAVTLLGAVANVQETNIPEAEKLRWESRKKELLRYAMAVQQSEDIEQQRKSFEPLTNALYLVLTDIGAGTKQVYKQYCPMAFNDKGAYWLSDKEEIMNPYFGDAMLHCGVVKEVLSLNNSNK